MAEHFIWIGIGCRRGTSKTTFQAAIAEVVNRYQLNQSTIVGLATIDLKSDEIGLVEYCRDHHLPLQCFSANQLNSVTVPNPSSRVADEIATTSVAEAAAMVAAKTQTLIVPKQVIQGVTIAIAESSLS